MRKYRHSKERQFYYGNCVCRTCWNTYVLSWCWKHGLGQWRAKVWRERDSWPATLLWGVDERVRGRCVLVLRALEIYWMIDLLSWGLRLLVICWIVDLTSVMWILEGFKGTQGWWRVVLLTHSRGGHTSGLRLGKSVSRKILLHKRCWFSLAVNGHFYGSWSDEDVVEHRENWVGTLYLEQLWKGRNLGSCNTAVDILIGPSKWKMLALITILLISTYHRYCSSASQAVEGCLYTTTMRLLLV